MLQVVVAEGSPAQGGHDMAAQLAAAGINTTAIADSAIFALMARVNKASPRVWGFQRSGLQMWGVQGVWLCTAGVLQCTSAGSRPR